MQQSATPNQNVQGATPENEDEELDRRIREALIRSEETIRRSPVRHILENQNAYYNHFLSSYASKYDPNAGQSASQQLVYERNPEYVPSNEAATSKYGTYIKALFVSF